MRKTVTPVKRFAVLTGWVALALVVASCTSASSRGAARSAKPSTGATTAATVGVLSSSRVIVHGRVRCTAKLTTPLQAGQRTGLAFALHNISRRTIKVSWSPWEYAFVLHTGSGIKFDSRVPLAGETGGIPVPTPIPAGATKIFRPADAWVRWAGPLSLQPICSGATLPVLRSAVAAPGPAPTASRAIASVVAAAGHVFDHCRPTRLGTPVTGEIHPPSGAAPPMHASCSLMLQREGPFWIARTLIRVPASLRGVTVSQPYEQISMPRGRHTAEAIAWEFVVTADGALPVASDTVDTTKSSNAMAPDWGWTGNRWQGPGGSRCGGELSTGGGSPNVTIEFVSVCPS